MREAAEAIQRGLGQLGEGRAQEGLQSFLAAAAVDPSNPAAFLFAAIACNDLSHFDEAREHVARVRSLSPDHQAVDTVECLVNLKSGRLGEAVAYLQKNPDLSLSSPIISRVTLEMERRLLGAELPALNHTPPVTRAPELEQEKTGCLSNLGIGPSFRAGGLHHRAQKNLERALKAGPGEERTRRIEESIAMYREARELDPSMFRADYYVGEALLYGTRREDENFRERLEEARQCFFTAWKKEGENPYLFHFLGRVSLALGEIDAAIYYHQQTLERFSKFFESQYALGQCYLLLGDEKKALDYFTLSLRSDTYGIRDRILQLVRTYERDPALLEQPLPEWEPVTTPGEPDTDPAPDPRTEAPVPPPEPEPPAADRTGPGDAGVETPG